MDLIDDPAKILRAYLDSDLAKHFAQVLAEEEEESDEDNILIEMTDAASQALDKFRDQTRRRSDKKNTARKTSGRKNYREFDD